MLAKRELLDLRRDYVALLTGVVLSAMLNLIFGIIFLNMGDREADDFEVSNAFGALVFIIISAMFGAAEQPLLAFPLERGIFLREYQTGTVS